jgi:hypothetical protein
MVCKWRDLRSRSPFSFAPSEVQLKNTQGEPVFLCSSVIRSGDNVSIIPGKATLWGDRMTVHYGQGKKEHEHRGTIRLLINTDNMRWVRTSKGKIPTGCRPVLGGSNAHNQELYHCVVWWKGCRVPGLTSRQMQHARITREGSVWKIADDYELLCWC